MYIFIDENNESFKISRYEVEHTDINTFQVSLYSKDEFGNEFEIKVDEIVLFEDVDKLFQDLRFNYLNKLQGGK